MTRQTIIVDVETTSLAPQYETGSGVIWELAAIVRDTGAEHLWRMKPDTDLAEPEALEIGRYQERTQSMRLPAPTVAAPGGSMSGVWDLAREGSSPFWSDPADLARALPELLDDVILVAANPAFDAGFLSAFLFRYGQHPLPWHYRLRDIGSMAWARSQAHHLPHHLPTPPIDASTDDFAMAMGIDPEDFERHSALGDCRLVAAMLDRIERGPVQ